MEGQKTSFNGMYNAMTRSFAKSEVQYSTSTLYGTALKVGKWYIKILILKIE